MKAKHLLFLTSEFPFGKGETFIENELPFLEEAFENVTIVSLSPDEQQSRSVGANTSVYRHPIILSTRNKIAAFRWLTHRDVLQELWRLCFVYRLFPSPARIFTILFSWDRANRLTKVLRPLLKDNTIAYAYWTDDSALALAQLMGKGLVQKSISRCHRWDIYFEESSIQFLPFRKKIYKELSSIVSISQDGLNYIKNSWFLSDHKKLLLSRLGTLNGSSKELKEKLHLISCSNIIPVKRVHLIAEALSLISEVSIKWTHFGDGTMMDNVLHITTQESFIHEVMLKGRRTNSEVKDFLRFSDTNVFINVSSSEGIPVSIMEAMSFGLPVIAAEVGGNAEIVNEQNGWLLPKDLDEVIIKELLLAICSSSKCEITEKGRNAFRTWEEFYDAQVNYTSFTSWLRQEL